MMTPVARARPSVPMLLLSMAAAAAIAAGVWIKMELARLDGAIAQAHAAVKTLAIGGRLPSAPDVAAYLSERGRALEAHYAAAREWLTAPSEAAAAGVDPQLYFQQRMHEVQQRLERLAVARQLSVPSMLGLPKELPPSDAVPRFLVQVRVIEELAEVVFAESGVSRIESFKVEDPQPLPAPGEEAQSFLLRLPVRVRLACPIEALAKVLGRLERVHPLINLESLHLAANGHDGEMLIDLSAARYLTTSELIDTNEPDGA